MREIFTTAGEVVGAALIAVGCFQIASFFGWIAAGVATIAVSYMAAR